MLTIGVTGGKGDGQMAGKGGLDLQWLQFLPRAHSHLEDRVYFKVGSSGQSSGPKHSCGGAQQPCFLLEEVR